MKKIKFLTKLLLLCLLVSLTNCQKEEQSLEALETSDKVQDILSKNISIDDIANSGHVSNLLRDLASGNSLQRTLDMDSISIDMDDILFMEYGNTHTLTFKIVSSTPEYYIENIVLHYNIDHQDYDEYLVQYNVTAEEYIEIANGSPLNESTEIHITALDAGTLSGVVSRSCIRTCRTVSVSCTAGGDHDFGESCSGGPDQQPYQYQLCTTTCPTITPVPGSGGGGNGPSGGSGGGSDDTQDDNNIITNPNASLPCETGRGNVGISGNNGCITTADIEARNQLFTRLESVLTNQAQADWIALEADLATVNAFNNYLDEGVYPLTDQYNEFAVELISVIMLDSQININALEFTLEAYRQDKIYNDLDNDFLNSVNQFINIDIAANPLIIYQIELYFTTKCAVLRYNHPDWSDLEIYWEATKDLVHIALDVFGMIPVVGEIADLTNGVLYLIEGDGVNATLSFAATVPILGWGATTGKYVFKITATTLGTKVRLTWKVLENGIVYFGSSGAKLRKALGITDSTVHAHHLIPWATRNFDVVQKAAKSGNAFHINEVLNGIPMPNNLHLTGHSHYSDVVGSILTGFNPNANIDEAYDFVSGFAQYLENLIRNNQTLNSGQIADLISYP